MAMLQHLMFQETEVLEESQQGEVSPPKNVFTKWERVVNCSGKTVVVAWILRLASSNPMPWENKWATIAANSNSLAALAMALAEFKAPWIMLGSIGHCFSTKWLRISHGHPSWMSSQHVSSFWSSKAGCPSGRHPWLMALKKAVVWLVDKLRKPGLVHVETKQQF